VQQLSICVLQLGDLAKGKPHFLRETGEWISRLYLG